ncbi:hypothetical protein ACFCYB_33905 [Streptomyces sp. NPDC056309]|uniref:hypothetical protein n=1 Tax=unclassified Streptomyces TaxID=2593676 RepID=UPI0035DA5736
MLLVVNPRGRQILLERDITHSGGLRCDHLVEGATLKVFLDLDGAQCAPLLACALSMQPSASR